jgi:hypothetical protein
LQINIVHPAREAGKDSLLAIMILVLMDFKSKALRTRWNISTSGLILKTKEQIKLLKLFGFGCLIDEVRKKHNLENG